MTKAFYCAAARALAALSVGLVALSSLSACTPSEGRPGRDRGGASSPPNIIFIMADDLGYGDLGSYGQAAIQTPNLDRMAREGTRFTQYYAGSTVCAPSRYALMTGRHTGHTLSRGNVSWPRGDVPLRARDTTLGEIVDRVGYATGVYGKWALGLKGTSGAPHRQGFDAFLGYEDQTEAHHYYVNRLQGIEHGVTVNVEVDTTQYTHALFAEAALAFVERHQEEPFFLYLPFTLPHAELTAPEKALQPYLNAQGESVFSEPEAPSSRSPSPPNATYAAMISQLDRDVGRLLDKLKTLGLAENTIVFLTSDNGPHAEGGHEVEVTNSNGPLRGLKRDLYEGGIRVPMLAWGPGRVPAGCVSDQVWAAWDVVPTVAALSGGRAPKEIDGRSMAQAITACGEPRPHEPLYWEFHGGETAEAVRDGRWKAVRQPMLTGPLELYDLQADLGEQRNVADQHPEAARQMRQLMDEAHTAAEHPEFRLSEEKEKRPERK